MKKSIFIFALLLFALSCGKDDPQPINDEELITTLILEFKNGNDTKILKFQDLDGDGGNAPVITSDTLNANLTYSVKIFVLNESELPSEDITLEILEEGDEHQFFFLVDSTLNLTTTYNDLDENNKPIGLESIFVTGAASQGDLVVILKHQPDKFAPNVSEGDVANSGGETDIEVSFRVVVN